MGNTMIGMALVICGLFAHQAETVLVKNYGKKYGNGGMFFNAIICLFAMIYFIITDKGGLQFPNGIWIYGIINSFMYAIGFYTAYAAFKIGSFGLTRLLTSFGVIITTFYGIIFLKEQTTPFTYAGIALIALSLFLMNYQKSNSNEKTKFSLKWIVYVLLVILSNAAITVIGKIQYGKFGDTYKNEFLIISLAGAALALFIFGFILERGSFKSTIKHGFLYGASAGIFNGINNLFVLITYNYISDVSITAPVRSGLGMVIAFAVSIIFYREKFSCRQFISAGIGIVAIILMNIKIG